MADKNVIIVGGGVIGLLLAKELGRSGIQATVYESKPRVSDGAAKASGIFSISGLERIGVDYSKAKVNMLQGARIHAGGETFEVDAKAPKAYVLDRGRLADICKREAEEAGAEVVLGRRFSREDIVDMAADGRNVLVGADGATSTVASALGFPKISEYVLTYKTETRMDGADGAHMVDLFFSNRVYNRFFGWLVPYGNGIVEAGVGISSLSRRNSASVFHEFANAEGLEARPSEGYASMIPLQTRARTVMGNALLVGDAAGQVKATTGGGIVFGASCAKVAAEAITSHIRKGTALGAYERAWRDRYGMDLKLHGLLHRWYSGMGDGDFRSAIRIAKLLRLQEFFSRHGDMDSPKLMLKRLLTGGLFRK